MTDDDLHEFISGWKPNTRQHIAGTEELTRRRERPISIRAWVAIGISAVSLIVSLFALGK